MGETTELECLFDHRNKVYFDWCTWMTSKWLEQLMGYGKVTKNSSSQEREIQTCGKIGENFLKR